MLDKAQLIPTVLFSTHVLYFPLEAREPLSRVVHYAAWNAVSLAIPWGLRNRGKGR